ncbi:Isotrichodermin C-15 hydroxylase [Emericellopsis cladophorae]|uniref:Isotrichodermin C-15 hydroxylase n=1 Tax=Emericellopsis cladophorae TaxID=2686198 RepID=A0A9P9Y2E6_9HYPO|nr:Isotrichodermin C-15 hydroxylase [Emericellopsis cladophorae]KAI6782247.1 Isotrichodermin C-15 hydroxylase [Emericellopsis cladophorae]
MMAGYLLFALSALALVTIVGRGDHVRYAPNRLIFNTEPALRDIYGHRGKVVKFRNYHVLSKQAANLLTLQDKYLHGRRRRVISQAFSESSLRMLEPKIHSKLDQFCHVLRAQGGSDGSWAPPFDMSHAFNNLAFDIMTSVSFDIDFDTIANPEYRYAMEAIEHSNVRLGVLLQEPALSLGDLDRKLFPQAILGRRRFVQFIRMLMSKRLGGRKSASKDIFAFLQDCKDPLTGKELTTAELSTETATFIVAGADTSSTSMAALAHYITGSSRCYKRAVEEVRSTFSSTEEITLGAKLNSCAYLRACVDESLRLSPPGGAALWREVEEGGATIDGHFIPQKCEVAVGIYSIHHSEAYYTQPFRFDPMRWYRPKGVEAAQQDAGKNPYMPFSVGPRSCVGKPLAIANIMLVFARLLLDFDLKREGRSDDWVEQNLEASEYSLKDHLTAWKDGPTVCLRPRKV